VQPQTVDRISDQTFFLCGATSFLNLSILNSCIRAAAENSTIEHRRDIIKSIPWEDYLHATDVAEKIANISQFH
jgi:hypothetical protein